MKKVENRGTTLGSECGENFKAILEDESNQNKQSWLVSPCLKVSLDDFIRIHHHKMTMKLQSTPRIDETVRIISYDRFRPYLRNSSDDIVQIHHHNFITLSPLF